jgi:hypothetical protein
MLVFDRLRNSLRHLHCFASLIGILNKHVLICSRHCPDRKRAAQWENDTDTLAMPAAGAATHKNIKDSVNASMRMSPSGNIRSTPVHCMAFLSTIPTREVLQWELDLVRLENLHARLDAETNRSNCVIAPITLAISLLQAPPSARPILSIPLLLLFATKIRQTLSPLVWSRSVSHHFCPWYPQPYQSHFDQDRALCLLDFQRVNTMAAIQSSILSVTLFFVASKVTMLSGSGIHPTEITQARICIPDGMKCSCFHIRSILGTCVAQEWQL